MLELLNCYNKHVDTEAIVGRPYLPRMIDSALQEILHGVGAVIIEGPRGCGKTMSALNAANSYIFLDTPHAKEIFDFQPELLLRGDTPRLLDEWQVIPESWNLVRREVDGRAERGRFILTGSALPADDITRHTGAGRFLRLTQQTMTTCEKDQVLGKGSSMPSISLRNLFAGEFPDLFPGQDDPTSAINLLCRPGFPDMLYDDFSLSSRRISAYIDEVTRLDLSRLAEIRHSPQVIKAVLQSVARSVISELTIDTIRRDIMRLAAEIQNRTISNYLELLGRIFVVQEIPAWLPQLRTRARLRTASKYHLADPAMAVNLLGTTPTQLAYDPKTLGLILESAVLHDLHTLISFLGGRLYHYRDSSGREIDGIVTLPDGRWAGMEVKLGTAKISQAGQKLQEIVNTLDLEVMKKPSFLAVVTLAGPIAKLTKLENDVPTFTFPIQALGV